MDPGEENGGEVAFLRWATEMERSVREIRSLLDVVGRASIGSNLLLSHWMARSGGPGATEQDLAEALSVAAASEWASRLGALGIRGESDEPKVVDMEQNAQ